MRDHARLNHIIVIGIIGLTSFEAWYVHALCTTWQKWISLQTTVGKWQFFRHEDGWYDIFLRFYNRQIIWLVFIVLSTQLIGFRVIQGIPAFHDFRIRDPGYFVIQFQALILWNSCHFMIFKKKLYTFFVIVSFSQS